MKKKIITLMMAMALAFGTAACGGAQAPADGANEPAAEEGAAEATDEAASAEKAKVDEADGDAASDEAAAEGYRVIVKDADGPVKGVTIQFCDDERCNFKETEEDGVVFFDMPEGVEYEVHVLKTPDGYAKDETVYKTEKSYGDVEITLEREQ